MTENVKIYSGDKEPSTNDLWKKEDRLYYYDIKEGGGWKLMDTGTKEDYNSVILLGNLYNNIRVGEFYTIMENMKEDFIPIKVIGTAAVIPDNTYMEIDNEDCFLFKKNSEYITKKYGVWNLSGLCMLSKDRKYCYQFSMTDVNIQEGTMIVRGMTFNPKIYSKFKSID